MTKAPPLSQQVIWLTGASSGIGEALADELAPRCKALIISARSEDKLRPLADRHSNVTVITADITDEESLRGAASAIEKKYGQLDTLIANAGTCEYVDVTDFDTALFRRVFETNMMGLVNTTAAALPLLQKSQRGYLVGVGSSVSMLAMPRAQAYGSSKAAVAHFLESMKADLKAMGIDVSLVSPGFVKTPLTDANDFPMPMRISAEQAAEEIVKGVEKRQWHIHFPKGFTRILWFIGQLPAFLRHRITAQMSRTDEMLQQQEKRQMKQQESDS